MKYTVLLAKSVEEELEQAAIFLEENRTGFGILFLNEFDEVISYLSRNPYAFQ